MLNIAGNLCELGDITADAVPGFRLQCPDGRLITITGLTREETRALVPDLFRNVVLTFADRPVTNVTIALADALEKLMELERRGRVMPIGAEWDAARAALALVEGA